MTFAYHSSKTASQTCFVLYVAISGGQALTASRKAYRLSFSSSRSTTGRKKVRTMNSTALLRGRRRNVWRSYLMRISSTRGGGVIEDGNLCFGSFFSHCLCCAGGRIAYGSCWNMVSFACVKKVFLCTGLETWSVRKNLEKISRRLEEGAGEECTSPLLSSAFPATSVPGDEACARASQSVLRDTTLLGPWSNWRIWRIVTVSLSPVCPPLNLQVVLVGIFPLSLQQQIDIFHYELSCHCQWMLLIRSCDSESPIRYQIMYVIGLPLWVLEM
jgi:hypothetical protein